MLPGQSCCSSSVHRLVRDAGDRLPHLLGVLREEVLGEQRDVLAALAQRRQRDRDDVDAVEQILAEPALGDQPSADPGWSRR